MLLSFPQSGHAHFFVEDWRSYGVVTLTVPVIGLAIFSDAQQYFEAFLVILDFGQEGLIIKEIVDNFFIFPKSTQLQLFVEKCGRYKLQKLGVSSYQVSVCLYSSTTSSFAMQIKIGQRQIRSQFLWTLLQWGTWSFHRQLNHPIWISGLDVMVFLKQHNCCYWQDQSVTLY